jgi:carbon-monoxide dehydrogenase medium subunit
MYAFDYHRATSVADAAAKLAAAGDGKFLAGGQTLIPTLKQRLASPSDLVDLAGIAELVGAREEDDGVTIGAMTRHAQVAESAVVRRIIPALAHLAEGIGDPLVRNRGTIGGSIANNDPAADYPSAVLALAATVRTDRRSIAADDFFDGLFTTALEEGELITAIHFPKPAQAGYAKFPNPASRYATVGVFVVRTHNGVRVAVTGAGENGVFRATGLERALAADFSPAAVDRVAIPADGLNGDIHASAEYRAHLVGVMTKRAVIAAGG